MARPKPPPLYRISRGLRIASVLVVVLIVAYLIFAGISIFRLSASDISGYNTIDPTIGNQSAGVSGELAITNPGVAPVNSIQFNGEVRLENQSVLLHFHLPSISLGPSASGRLPFDFQFAIANNSPAATLLFHDNTLHILFAVNVTYAYVFNVSVLATTAFSWGAPFYNLTVTPGTPTVEPNGTGELPVTVSFSNHARFTVAGLMLADVNGPEGKCGSGSLAVSAPGGEDYQFQNTTVVVGNAACLASATSVTLYYYTPGGLLSLQLPPEALA